VWYLKTAWEVGRGKRTGVLPAPGRHGSRVTGHVLWKVGHLSRSRQGRSDILIREGRVYVKRGGRRRCNVDLHWLRGREELSCGMC
jgi:hypothetical protein